MRVLVVGSGVIGSVYGAHLAAAGHPAAILAHGARNDRVAQAGLAAHDVITGHLVNGPATVVPDAAGGPYDLVVVAVRSDQLAGACAPLAALAQSPAVLFLGNNPAGRSAIGGQVRGDVQLGFPGVGGVLPRAGRPAHLAPARRWPPGRPPSRAARRHPARPEPRPELSVGPTATGADAGTGPARLPGRRGCGCRRRGRHPGSPRRG